MDIFYHCDLRYLMNYYEIGRVVEISPDAVSAYFGDGWANHEYSYIWSQGNKSSIRLEIGPMFAGGLLRLNAESFTGYGEIPYQDVNVLVGGKSVGSLSIPNSLGWHEIRIPEGFVLSRTLEIDFCIEKPLVPSSYGVSEDHRELGLRVCAFQLIEATEQNIIWSDARSKVAELAIKISQTGYNLVDSNLLLQAAIEKQKRRKIFQSIGKLSHIYASEFFSPVRVENIDSFGAEITFFSPSKLKEIIFKPGSIVVLNNNDCHYGTSLDAYIEVYLKNKDVQFIVWDYDNHHWFTLSLDLALYSDSYAPAHHENYALLSMLSGRRLDVVPCGVSQFTHDFIEQNLEFLSSNDRKQEPLGKHVLYGHELRNFVINKVAADLPSVGFTEGSYRDRTQEERLHEWASYTASFVSPVFGDVPIRIFDSLITGGIPIVPFYIDRYLEKLGIDRDWYVVYQFEDILEPKFLAEEANKKFAIGGADGVKSRILWTLKNHHLTSSLDSLITNYFNLQKSSI